MLAGLEDVPAYYAHMGPVNAAGPTPVDLTPPQPADAEQIAARLAAGEWIVDLRNRVAFAAGLDWAVVAPFIATAVLGAWANGWPPGIPA